MLNKKELEDIRVIATTANRIVVKYFDVEGILTKKVPFVHNPVICRGEERIDHLGLHLRFDCFTFELMMIKEIRSGVYAISLKELGSIAARDYNSTVVFPSNYVFNHGLNAWNEKDIKGNIEGILSHPEWEICCSYSPQYLGTVGLYIKGTCLLCANEDIFSFIDEDGHRCINSAYVSKINKTFNDIDLTIAGEAILTDTEIVGAWMTESMHNTTEGEELEIFLYEKGFDVKVVPDAEDLF